MKKAENSELFKPKTSSIVWQINGNIQWSKLKKFVFWDLIFWICGVAGACAAIEYQYGIFDPFLDRTVSWQPILSWERLKSIEYQFMAGTKMETVPLGMILSVSLIVLGTIFGIQMLGWLLDWSAQNHRLRRYMRPIDELALTAEKLSLEGIDENSIQNLEEAIDQITLAQTDISTGDQDLKGLETAINNLLKRLQASYREQTRFVDDASHELRTPIAVIQGYASMLQRWGMDDRKTLEESVDAISEESAHMKELVDQLLFLARGDGGRQQFHKTRMNVSELLKEVCEESEMIDQKHRYILRESGQEEWITADPAMLKQAVRILTDNAAKYTPEGGAITFRIEKSSDFRIGLSVEDEGIGMEPSEVSHIFERFFRSEDVRGVTKGSGLGLSIAEWIAQHHHGCIKAVSYKGVGTRMTIELPKNENDTEK